MDCQKELFYLPEDITYLNCAYMSPMLRTVRTAADQGLEKKMFPYTIGRDDFFRPADEVRSLFAQLIHADEPNRIALIPAVSYGMETAVANIPLESGDKIVLLGEQFPSNVYPWRTAAAEKHCEIVAVHAPEGTSNRAAEWNARVLDAIDEKVKVVALANVHWTDGTLFDLKKIGDKARAVGAWFIIDGTQSVGALPINVAELKPDALICAGYKWLMGAYGLGLAYYGPRFDGGKPIENNWINREGSSKFENLVKYQDNYQSFARRYDAGESGNYLLLVMLAAALRTILQWTPKAVQEYTGKISAGFLEEVQDIGAVVENKRFRAAHLFGVRLPSGTDLVALQRELEQQKTYVSVRGNAVRLAPHVYNTQEDFSKLLNCLKSQLVAGT